MMAGPSAALTVAINEAIRIRPTAKPRVPRRPQEGTITVRMTPLMRLRVMAARTNAEALQIAAQAMEETR